MADVAAQVPGIDTSTPSIARVYDYLLGGKDNFACDRAVAAQLADAVPDLTLMARQNRAFLGRVVRFLADQGIRQFIDIGTGLPTQDNVHQVAQSVVPDARVVYVDNDPIVLAHARALLAENANTVAVEGDLREPERILADPGLRGMIDLTQPVAVLLVGILYFFPAEERPFEIVATLRDAVAPGSFVALSHVVTDLEPDAIGAAQEIYRAFLHTAGDARRTTAQVARFFDGLDLWTPGLVPVRDWPTAGADPSAATSMVGGVGRKP